MPVKDLSDSGCVVVDEGVVAAGVLMLLTVSPVTSHTAFVTAEK